jgi:hypothetical protein
MRLRSDDPDLPVAVGTVTAVADGGKSSNPVVRYTAEGRQFTKTVGFSGRFPPVGGSLAVRYVPGHPERVRPVGSAYDPGWPFLFLFSGLALLIPAIMVPATVISTRRRLRREQQHPTR